MSLRLGVLCAVIDGSGCILLSRRGDLNIWTLPGGRLDAGERLEHAAQREVGEETGVSVEIERSVGLYYLADWHRLNVLYEGYPVGGRLQDTTRETRANRYFTDGSIPQGVIGAREALAVSRPSPRIIASPRRELWRLRLRFGWRWLVNRLSGHPEPRFPVFEVRAVAVILGDTGRRVLTVPDLGQQGASYRALPQVVCDGSAAPWEQLADEVRRASGIQPELHWVGLWEDSEHAQVTFVFAASASERGLSGEADCEWTGARNGAFGDPDKAFVERVRPGFRTDPIWSLVAQDDDVTDMITLVKEPRI